MKRERPMVGPIGYVDLPRPKRGPIPQTIDERHVTEALRGRDTGEYVSASNAAWRISEREYHGDKSRAGFDALRKKLAQHFEQFFTK